jgi:hypothetical protein
VLLDLPALGVDPVAGGWRSEGAGVRSQTAGDLWVEVLFGIFGEAGEAPLEEPLLGPRLG